MPTLVTRFHLLLLAVTLAITGVALLHLPADFAFVAHWSGSTANWLWPRDLTLATAPLLAVVLLLAFFSLGRRLTKNQFAKSQHILDPALTLLLSVLATTQLGLLLAGIGSDLDAIRLTGLGLGVILVVLGVVLFEAERHTYAGLRMPWPIAGDAAWTLVHRVSGTTTCLAGIVLLVLAWLDVGIGLMVIAFAGSVILPGLVAGVATLLARR